VRPLRGAAAPAAVRPSARPTPCAGGAAGSTANARRPVRPTQRQASASSIAPAAVSLVAAGQKRRAPSGSSTASVQNRVRPAARRGRSISPSHSGRVGLPAKGRHSQHTVVGRSRGVSLAAQPTGFGAFPPTHDHRPAPAGPFRPRQFRRRRPDAGAAATAGGRLAGLPHNWSAASCCRWRRSRCPEASRGASNHRRRPDHALPTGGKTREETLGSSDVDMGEPPAVSQGNFESLPRELRPASCRCLGDQFSHDSYLARRQFVSRVDERRRRARENAIGSDMRVSREFGAIVRFTYRRRRAEFVAPPPGNGIETEKRRANATVFRRLRPLRRNHPPNASESSSRPTSV